MAESSENVVVCSVLERDAERTAARVAAAPRRCALVEIRADRLRAEDVRGLVGSVARDVIVTARRPEHGGAFDGSEDERRALLEAALDAGARYVDVELGLPVAELAEGAHAARTILSHHGAACEDRALRELLQRLEASRAAKLKLVPAAASADELVALRDVLRRGAGDRRLACFAMGRAGALSRIAALAWGSWATYGSAAGGVSTAPGQFSVIDLLEVYDVRGIARDTIYFTLLGSHVFGSPSPAMHNAAYREAAFNARYVPVELDDLDDLRGFEVLVAAGVVPFRGLAVTMPLKGAVAGRCATLDPVASRAQAVNTVPLGPGIGYNTDGPAAVACVRRHVDPAGRVAVLGAGGTARAIGAAFRMAGAEVTLYARDPARAAAAGKSIGARVEAWERATTATWDILVNATPLGAAGEKVPAHAALVGRVVLDAVYGPAGTPLVAAARERGLATVDGFELLVEQAVLQFELFGMQRPDPQVLRDAGRRWLDARARQ